MTSEVSKAVATKRLAQIHNDPTGHAYDIYDPFLEFLCEYMPSDPFDLGAECIDSMSQIMFGNSRDFSQDSDLAIMVKCAIYYSQTRALELAALSIGKDKHHFQGLTHDQ